MKRQKKRIDIYADSEISKMNSTSQQVHKFLDAAVVPKVVANIACLNDRILDFGAGKTAYHARELQKLGFNVVAYDIGKNYASSIHDQHALERTYTLIYASNVLNVQPREKSVDILLNLWWNLLVRRGVLVVNYPQQPRYTNLTTHNINRKLDTLFDNVDRIRGYTSPVWVCYKQ